MLTPAFELEQDPTFLTIAIKARYAKVTETEIFVDGEDFKFHSNPYFLRLNLPGRLIEDGREKASYDVEKGTFTVKIPKETQGEEFKGLDLLTKLLAPSGQMSAKEPCIEVLGNNEGGGETTEESEDNEDDIDWQVVQQPFYGDEDDKEKIDGNLMYGFANRRTGVFKRLRDEVCGVVDIEEADSVSLPERKRARMIAENDKFDDSHYLADLYQDDAIQTLLQYQPSWLHNYKKMREKKVIAGETASNQDFTYNVNFTEEEKKLMLKLPRKEFILNKIEEYGALLGVADILFAYAYNVRSTEGENSVESAWTVCKLSSTLSCLDWFQTPREMVVACCRRALCYPLYRSWSLCCKLLKDVRMMLRLGRNQVLKCFFEIHKLLSHDEPRYILNDLYISDYCVWLQSISNERLALLEQQISEIKLEKKDVGLDLDDLEEAASLVQNEEMMSVGTDDQRAHHHDMHHPSQEQSGEEQSSIQSDHVIDQVIHQVGYPDLIQRSNSGPDVVTAHVVRAAETVTMATEDVAYTDSDDGDNDFNPGELRMGKCDSDEGATSKGTPANNALLHIGASCNLVKDFVEKVSLVSTDNFEDSRPVQGISSCDNADFHSDVDSTHTKKMDESGNDRTFLHQERDDGEVVSVMQDMLNQLNLEPQLQSSSSSSTTPSSLTPSSSSAASLPSSTSGTTGGFLKWAQTPPTTLVEMFEGK